MNPEIIMVICKACQTCQSKDYTEYESGLTFCINCGGIDLEEVSDKLPF